MKDLVVVGGEVLTPAGWSASDVFIRQGRIVTALSNVRDGWETTVDGAGGTYGERRTGGAGAERAALAVTVEGEAVPAARDRALAAGGGLPVPPVGSVAGSAGRGGSGTAAPVPADATRLDAAGLRVVPGFVDLQCNGGFGIDLASEPERLWELAARLPRTGVTAWLPTIVSGPPSVRERALASLRAGPSADEPVAAPIGLQLEGPFLAPGRRGAHREAFLRPPDPAAVATWSRDAGVALVTLAPELPGALEVVRRLDDRGVVVSAGHSDATAAQAIAAVDAGVRWVTHLFNAMRPLHHRDPGLAGMALADDRLRVGVIADGLHLDPLVVTLAARALGERLTLVTDAVAALGLARRPGETLPVGLGRAVVGDDGVRLADGRLAGSDLSLDQAVRNLSAFTGADRAAAVRAATAAPAAVLGAGDRGVIAPGAVGDLVVLDADGEVVATVVGGDVAYDRRSAGG